VKITPLDIQQQQFTIRFRGYDTQEVDSFLESVANALEEQIKRSNELKEEVERKEERIWEYQNMEKTLKETLLMAQAASEEMKKNAQKMADDVRANAEKEAELTIVHAKQQAEKIIEEVNSRFVKLQAEYSETKRKKILLEQDLRKVLETHLKLLEAATESTPGSPEFRIPKEP
jgi:cell division initiation protein